MTGKRHTVGITGVGVALPPHRGFQGEVLESFRERVGDWPAPERVVRRLFERARIDHRQFCIPDFSGSSDPVLYRGHEPALAERMEVFAREAPRLAGDAARAALQAAGKDVTEIGGLVVVNSTGVLVPGLDVRLVDDLQLPYETRRLLVSMAGCSGAFSGIRAAHGLIATGATSVLVVCVELCSIHGNLSGDASNVVAHAIFGDAAAAVVLEDDPISADLHLGEEFSSVVPNTKSELGWRLTDRGFEVSLSPSLPTAIISNREIIRRMVGSEKVDHWVLHPGGASVVRALVSALELSVEDVAATWKILRTTGNTSSCGVILVLNEVMDRLLPGDAGLMLGFGPGLVVEGLRFRRRP